MGSDVSPGSDYDESRAGLERAVRDVTQTVYHPVGTCRHPALAASAPLENQRSCQVRPG